MKTRRKSIYAVLALTLAACSPNAVKPAPPAARAEGGVSGGGGGTVPSNAAGVDAIQTAIEQSRLALTLYFKDQSLLRRNGEVSSGALLFDSSPTIFDVIQSTKIEVKEDGPCIDPNGEEKDGAAPALGAHSICISAKTLSTKLTTDNEWDQSVALVGHELSHLLGTNEDQALKIQTDIITALGSRRASILSDIAVAGLLKLARTAGSVGAVRDYPNQFADPKTMNDQLQAAMAVLEDLLHSNLLFTNGLSAFNAHETDLWWGAYWKLQMISHYACSLDHSPSNPRDGICQKIIDDTFGTNARLSLPEIQNLMHSGAHSENPAGYAIRRIASVNDLNQEIVDFVQMAGVLQQAMRALPDVIASFDPLQKALVPVNNAIDWKTNRNELIADDFHISTNGVDFYSGANGGELHSDPGGPSYWTLESVWMEHGVPMRMNMYFGSDGTRWWVDTIRVSDGTNANKWVTFKGHYFESPLGTPFIGDLDLIQGSTSLHLRGIKLSAVLH